MKNQVPDKRVCLILDLLFGTEFQKCLRKPEIWILSNIRWNTTIWMISQIQIYEILVDLIMLWLSWKIFFFSLNKYFYVFFFFFLLHSDWKTTMKIGYLPDLCYSCHTVFLLSNIVININIFYLWLFFLKFGYLIFLYLFGSFVFMAKMQLICHFHVNRIGYQLIF